MIFLFANLPPAPEGNGDWYIYDVGGSRSLVSPFELNSAVRPYSGSRLGKNQFRVHYANQMGLWFLTLAIPMGVIL